jgi:aspartyl-tRNA(Asn)/glutamyl-tRNA(Gln) amidotransferase subunit B
MRLKSDAIDYRYFCEPNIINIDINNEIKSLDESVLDNLPSKIKMTLSQQQVPHDIIEQLFNDYDMYQLFKYVNEKIHNTNLVITWIVIELAALLKNDNKTYKSISHEMCNRFIEMFKLIEEGKINGKQAKTIFNKIYTTSKSAEELVKELGFIQITDESVIKKYLLSYIEQNQTMLAQYKERPERVEKFFIGLLMKDTKGQANPIIAINILKLLINN